LFLLNHLIQIPGTTGGEMGQDGGLEISTILTMNERSQVTQRLYSEETKRGRASEIMKEVAG
jgi:hypothetical protein